MNWKVWCAILSLFLLLLVLRTECYVLPVLQVKKMYNFKSKPDFFHWHDQEFLLCENSETSVSKVKNPALVSLSEDVLTCHSDVIYNWWSFQPHQ